MNTLLAVPNVQVGSSFTPLGADVIAHFRFTWPVKPPAGVTVMVELPFPPRLAMETCVPESANPAGATAAVTVTVRFVVATVEPPAAAFTAIVYAPGVVLVVVCSLSDVVVAVLPEMVAEVDGHTGADTAPVGPLDTVQVNVTAPVKPPEGVSVTVDVPVFPGLAIVTGVPEIVSAGTIGALTVTCTEVDAVIVPVAASTPFTVIESLPTGVDDVLWMVRLPVPPDAPAVTVPAAQVSPADAEEHVRLTTPVNPPEDVTVIVEVALAPGLAITAGTALSVKLGTGAALTVSGIVAEAVIFPVAASAPVTTREYEPAVVVEVETTLTVAVTADVPAMVALAGVHVGTETALAGPVIAQVRLTPPVNPPNGVTVMVAEVEAPGLESTTLAGPLTPIFGDGTPVTSMLKSFEADWP